MPLYRPGFIAPCLPTNGHAVPTGLQWVYEIKHDRYRFICRRDGDRVRVLAEQRRHRLLIASIREFSVHWITARSEARTYRQAIRPALCSHVAQLSPFVRNVECWPCRQVTARPRRCG
jgi:hypothetical protein